METIMNWSYRESLRSTLKFHHIQNIYKTLYYIYTDKHDCVYYQKMGQATCFREREIFQVSYSIQFRRHSIINKKR